MLQGSAKILNTGNRLINTYMMLFTGSKYFLHRYIIPLIILIVLREDIKAMEIHNLYAVVVGEKLTITQ